MPGLQLVSFVPDSLILPSFDRSGVITVYIIFISFESTFFLLILFLLDLLWQNNNIYCISHLNTNKYNNNCSKSWGLANNLHSFLLRLSSCTEAINKQLISRSKNAYTNDIKVWHIQVVILYLYELFSFLFLCELTCTWI